MIAKVRRFFKIKKSTLVVHQSSINRVAWLARVAGADFAVGDESEGAVEGRIIAVIRMGDAKRSGCGGCVLLRNVAQAVHQAAALVRGVARA